MMNEEKHTLLLDDDDTKSVLDEDQLSLGQEVKKKKIEQEFLRSVLARRPKGTLNLENADSLNLEGELFKKQRTRSKWDKYYCRLVPADLEILYYKSKEDCIKNKNPKNIQLSWMVAEKATDDDKLSQKQAKSSILSFGKAEVCTFRLSLYAPKRTFIMSAQNDQEINKWINSITSLMKTAFTEEERKAKENAAKELGTLEKEQLKLEREQYKAIVQALQTADIIPDKPSGKRKEGYLELQKQDGAWKKYYFILFKESLCYFNLHDKLVPRGVVVLDSITSIRVPEVPADYQNTPVMEPKQPVPSSSPPKIDLISLEDSETNFQEKKEKKEKKVKKEGRPPKQPFIIRTALRTCILRAKHKEAMKDWVIMIQQLRSSNNTAQVSDVVRNQDEVGGEPVLGPKMITYYVDGKQKVHKMKKDSIVLGRSSKADICVSDVKMSRNHCRIEMSANGVPVLYDLGSMGGTVVNGKKVIKVPLVPGDQIQLGTTTFTFAAENSKK